MVQEDQQFEYVHAFREFEYVYAAIECDNRIAGHIVLFSHQLALPDKAPALQQRMGNFLQVEAAKRSLSRTMRPSTSASGSSQRAGPKYGAFDLAVWNRMEWDRQHWKMFIFSLKIFIAILNFFTFMLWI